MMHGIMNIKLILSLNKSPCTFSVISLPFFLFGTKHPVPYRVKLALYVPQRHTRAVEL